MSITHIYPMNLQWNAQRMGTLSSVDVPGTIEVATPPEFDGGMPGIWSPEHLFVAAVSSCLMTTFLAIATNSRLAFQDFRCPAEGKLEMVDGKYRMTEVKLMPVVTLATGEDEEKAMRVLNKAEANCLISNSIHSRIVFEPKIEIAEQVL